MACTLMSVMLLLLTSYSLTSDACSCIRPRIQDSFCRRDFVAHVLVMSSGLYLWSPGGGDMTLIDEDHPKKYMAIRKHTVQALQVFKGDHLMQDGQIGIISAFAAGSLCGMRMANETEYMVFATVHDDDNLMVGGCSLTRSWEATSDTVKQAAVELSESPQSCMCKKFDCMVPGCEGESCQTLQGLCYNRKSYCLMRSHARCEWVDVPETAVCKPRPQRP